MWNAINFKAGLEYPPAWIVGAAAFAGIAWAGSLSNVAILAGAIDGIAVTLLVGWLAATARSADELEAELRDTRRREMTLHDRLESMQAVVWQCDGSLNRTFVSGAWTELTGQCEGDALNAGWRDLVHTDDLSHYQTSLRLATIEHEAGEVEYRTRTKDGAYVTMLERFVPVRDSDGAFTGLLGVAVDITQRKRLEADQRQHIDDLQNVVGSLNERADELVAKHEQFAEQRELAEQREQSMCDYLAALSADLRHPVGDIRDALGLLRQSDLDPQQKTNVQRLNDAVDSLSVLAERSVELTALNAGVDEKLEVESCDVRELVERVTDQLRDDADAVRLRLTSTVEGSVPAQVQTDPLRMRRVLLLMWRAAMTLVDRGVVTMCVSSEGKSGATAHLVFNVQLPAGSVSEESIERAFYPQQSLDSEGGGLGLGRCQRLAEQLGGRIGIERDERGAAGLWFRLDVPAVDAALDGRRSHNRLAQESIRCNLGLILDLSKGGMRVQSRRIPDESVVDIEVSDDEDVLLLRAQVVWSKKIGFRRNEVGLKFLDLSSELEARLANLGARNRVRRTFEAA